MQKEIKINTFGSGLYEITDEVTSFLSDFKTDSGLLNIFLKHTSAGLIIQENADPTAKGDLEEWIKREVPENQSYFKHTYEGADDMPSHIKSVLTSVSLNMPITNSSLNLGSWQGVYLWEFRKRDHLRKIILTISKSI